MYCDFKMQLHVLIQTVCLSITGNYCRLQFYLGSKAQLLVQIAAQVSGKRSTESGKCSFVVKKASRQV